MTALRNNWITALAVIIGAFLLFLALAIGLDTDDQTTTAGRIFGVTTMGIAALALFAGLWGLRSNRLSKAVSYGGVVLGVVGALVWFWMIIPPIIALIILWFGVVRDGLAREAHTRSAASLEPDAT